MGINQGKDAFEKDLENKGLISSVYNLNLCTVFDTGKNEYFASDTSKPSEDKLVDFINYSWGLWQKSVIEDGFILVSKQSLNQKALYLVWNASNEECVGFLDKSDAIYASTGKEDKSKLGVSNLADQFRDMNEDDALESNFSITEVLIKAQLKSHE